MTKLSNSRKREKRLDKAGVLPWLHWAQQIQAIAQNGLTFSKDPFDRERYEQLRALACEILEKYTGLDITVIHNLFGVDTGYATPKVDIRVVVFMNNKVLLVKQKDTGRWALPGGWADIGQSPSEVAIKELREETGYEGKPVKVIAIYDKKCHPHPPSAYYTYKILIQCELVGGAPSPGLEIDNIDFFDEHFLPSLSEERVTLSQLDEAFRHLRDPNRPTAFD